MAHEVTLITGDGTGPELAEAARKCIDATGVKINWDVQEAGVDVMARTGTPLPDATMDSVKRTKLCAEGARSRRRSAPAFAASTSICGRRLGLYACVRPCKQYKGVRSFFEKVPIDLVIVRENTEDLYAGVEFERGKPETAELIKFINEKSAGSKIKTGRAGDRRVDQADQRVRHRADRAVRLRLRPQERPQEGHQRPQGEHHEVQRRAVAGGLAAGGGTSIRTSNSKIASSTTCACSSCRSRSCTTCSCCRICTATC